MKERILKVLIVIFCILLLNYPISYSITNIKSIILVLEIMIFFLWIAKKMKFKKYFSFINEKNYFLIILIFSIITRIGIVLCLNSNIKQLSDFEIALNTAYSGNITDSYHLIFSHWNLYPLILNIFCNIFGNYQIVVLLFNAIVNILTSIMIYLLCNRIFNNKKYGFWASTIYIIWPANILYTLILTQEHVGILLLLTAVYLFLNSEKHLKEKYKYSYLDYTLLGLVIGLSIFFKNYAYVLFIAFVIYHFGYCLINKNTKRVVKRIIPLYIVMIFVYFSVEQLTYLMLDNLAEKPVSRNLLPYTLNIGLRGDGHWNREYAYGYRDLAAKNNYDFDKTNETIMSDLIDDLKKSDSSIWTYSFWNNKASLIFNGDDGRIMWITNSLKDNQRLSDISSKIINPINNIFFSIVSFLTVIAIVYTIFNQNLKLILIMLIVHGSALILLLIESQNRYKYPLLPFICIIASVGIIYLIDLIKKNVSKKINLVK